MLLDGKEEWTQTGDEREFVMEAIGSSRTSSYPLTIKHSKGQQVVLVFSSPLLSSPLLSSPLRRGIVLTVVGSYNKPKCIISIHAFCISTSLLQHVVLSISRIV